MNRLILGIDPGTAESGICLIEAKDFDQPNIVKAEKTENSNLFSQILLLWLKKDTGDCFEVVIEGMANQSRSFGQSSIETCYFIGRLLEHCSRKDIPVTLYKRHEYGRFFVHNGVLNDATLRAALETVWGPSAKKTDPLYLLRGASDKRTAFALCKFREYCLESALKTSAGAINNGAW